MSRERGRGGDEKRSDRQKPRAKLIDKNRIKSQNLIIDLITASKSIRKFCNS
jgi:hypothetical protein